MENDLNDTNSITVNTSISGNNYNSKSVQDCKIKQLISYLNKVSATLLEVDKDSVYKELVKNSELLCSFYNDNSNKILVITSVPTINENKDKRLSSSKTESSNFNTTINSIDSVISIETEFSFQTRRGEAIWFIKKQNNMHSDKPLNCQLQVMNFNSEEDGANIFGYMQTILQGAINPLFSSYKSAIAGGGYISSGDIDTKNIKLNTIESVNNKMNELVYLLHQSQKNSEIPNIKLEIEPEFKQICNNVYKTTGKTAVIDDFADKLNDDFLMKLIDQVNRWKVDISSVIKLDRNVNEGTTMQEINFWRDYESTILNIQDQINRSEVQLTLNVLAGARRFIVTNAFNEDTQLEPIILKVKSYNSFLKDLPILQLTASRKFSYITVFIKKIFEHLKTRIRNSLYPYQRIYQLIEVLSKDINNHLLDMLQNLKIMDVSYEEFSVVYNELKELFLTWNSEFDLAKKDIGAWQKTKRDTSYPTIPTSFPHFILEKRIKDVKKFRKEHNSLKEITETLIANTLNENNNLNIKSNINDLNNNKNNNSTDSSLIKELDNAYTLVANNTQVLDLSKEGEEVWVVNRNEYKKKTEKIEGQISNFLCNKLSSALNANEQFRIFSKFNKLISRQRIQNSIQQYQSQLVASITQSLKDLKNKIYYDYNNSSAYYLSKIRGIADTSGKIIWLKQFQRKINSYKDRLKMVLGEGWETHNEAKLAKDIIDGFVKLNPISKIIEAWTKESIRVEVDFGIEKVLKIVNRNDKYEIQVNFDEKVIDLFKDVRLISVMGVYTMNTFIISKANTIKSAYPIAISLQDSIRTFNQTIQRIDSRIAKLVAKQIKDIQDLIGAYINVQWSVQVKLEKFCKELCEKVSSFEELTRDLVLKADKIQALMNDIANSNINRDFVHNKIREIQYIINEIQEPCNLRIWINEQDLKLESILLKKLEDIINLFAKEFTDFGKIQEIFLIKEATIHKIKLKEQQIYLEPSIHEAREYWYGQLHKVFAIVCSAKRLDYNMENNLGINQSGKDKKEITFRDILNKLSPIVIKNAYEAVEKAMKDSTEYIQTWFSYQVLWDLQSKNIYDKLGDDMGKWQQLMNEIKNGRKTFDTSETDKQFGALYIDYSMVQSKISYKYDVWHKEIMNKFANTLNDNMKNFYTKIFNSRQVLENSNIDNSQTDVVAFITDLEESKRNHQNWKNEFDSYKSGKLILDKQRYRFVGDMCNIIQLESEWNKFNKILTKKAESMADQIPAIQQRIQAESNVIMNRIKELENYWNNKRPDKSENTTESLNIISTSEGMLKRVKDEYIRNSKAKEMLGLEFSDPARLETLEEEIFNLKEVWQALGKVWNSLDKYKETPFIAVVPEKVKGDLTEAQNQLNLFSNKLRQYSAYDTFKNKLANLKKINSLIYDLRTDAIKDRHWKGILSKLKMNKSINDLFLGDFWNANILSQEKPIRDIINQAQGELVLENFLRQSKDLWGNMNLELVNYKKKCNLIKGWDDLFLKLDEHINLLTSMTNSPYYNVFKDEIEPWKDKLEKIRILFNEWIDVQKRYVYLEGIFFGSSDIMTELGSEYNKFKAIDQEFTGLMKKVSSKPQILEVISIPSIKSILEEKLKNGLERIQKKLYDFLEKQRQYFARFYFIGDEDLLEIIGNSKEVSKIQRHFNKMFAGLNTLITKKEGDEITHMMSRESEEVELYNTIKISEDPVVYVWLKKVEDQMRLTLANLLEKAVNEISNMDYINKVNDFIKWIEDYPAQIVVLSSQILWSASVESALVKKQLLPTLPVNFNLLDEENVINNQLGALSDQVLKDITVDMRKKLEQLITELVHQRDVVRILQNKKIENSNSFDWLYYMRFYFQPKESNVLKKLQIKMSNAPFDYGFEYLGVAEKLIQTPLTDRCYLTLTQALFFRMGGAPFGPAGTGKTESVKALGGQLGRFVLVFNCDETFDFKAMGRIFIGLCQVGAWGCFDEFNRLEERILSAVSQQILIIQMGLKEQNKQIELLGKTIHLDPNVGSFITMNPDYSGRSMLPDNLKQLFRQMAMIKPDKDMIAQVTLYSQGYKTAERLSSKMVSLFDLCLNQLSNQSHYDFGLRALKSVLVNAGNLKRKEDKLSKLTSNNPNNNIEQWEQKLLLQSVCNTLIPKLISDDVPLYNSLLSGVFPDAIVNAVQEEELKSKIIELCGKRNLIPSDKFVDKLIQLYSIQKMNHGVMLVGGSGTGKTAAWRILSEAMQLVDNKKYESYIIDPKAINKDNLYGKLDPTTLDWTDGVFTGTLRKIIDNQRGESAKIHWIIFDGDVDPEWAENLNSVLDDNKLLTLPNDRLSIPSNVRIMFEVENLKHATLATVSRCGMVWFSEDIVSIEMIFKHYLMRLPQNNYDDSLNYSSTSKTTGILDVFQPQTDTNLNLRKQCVDIIKPLFEPSCFVQNALDISANYNHVMEYTKIRVIESMFALVRKGLSNILEYNETYKENPMNTDQIYSYLSKWVVVSIIWGFGGSLSLDQRIDLSNKLYDLNIKMEIDLPNASSDTALIDYEVKIGDNIWSPWKRKVSTADVDSNKVADADVVIVTVDTLRHQEILCSWLSEHRPFILCGPPGSGKTMTLMATLKVLTDFEMIFINFSSSTTPDLILKTFDHYCEYKKLSNGTVLRPKQANKWIILFCDEINLPEIDKYGTQVVITFLREITEQNGFWRPSDKTWISLDRIQFVGACNPPTDVGRHPLSNRFLRHTPLLYVDFPGPESLKQIYGSFNKALLRKGPSELRSYSENLTNAMVEFYTSCQKHYTPDIQPHYIYSPRELTRWKHAMNESIESINTLDDLVRLWAHEALRLFQDRLVLDEEKKWCDQLVDEIALKYFPNISMDKALSRPILFTNLINERYVSCSQEELIQNIEGKLKVFYEEELNVPLVIFDSVLEHILRIDRVLKQPIGHLLLVGQSGVGKTTLSRFVSWMNNLTVFQIKAGRSYSVEDFDDDLRNIMKRSGCKGEKICFIFDESNVLGPAFLERMNALLAAGEVPGLFEGEDYTSLISTAKECFLKENKVLDSEDEVYKAFIKGVQRNLHVVFTMNPLSPDFSNRAASSPALYNRCVIDWFGDWTRDGLYQVANKLTEYSELRQENFSNSKNLDFDSMRNLLVDSITSYHMNIKELNNKLQKNGKKFNYITPRDFLDFIKHFMNLQKEKTEDLNEQQIHINKGLQKIIETEETVHTMKQGLSVKEIDLNKKQSETKLKFEKIMADSEIARKSKEKAEEQKNVIHKMKAEIGNRTEQVEKELADVKPQMEEAKKAVDNMDSKMIAEIKGFRVGTDKTTPTLRMVANIYNFETKKKINKNAEWSEIKEAISKSDFINIIKNITDMHPKLVSYINEEKRNPNNKWDVNTIKGASFAVYTLAKWLSASTAFSEIANKVEPLKNEILELENKRNKVEEEYAIVENEIKDLEQRVYVLKQEHEQSVVESNSIKRDMEEVQNKVERSEKLLANLSSEKSRWSEQMLDFQRLGNNLLGDTFIASSFLAYVGFYDANIRKSLKDFSRTIVQNNQIIYTETLDEVDWLSKANDKATWQRCSLPTDAVCFENATVLQRFNRYPLVIDPANQASEFIKQYYSKFKLASTSFSDPNFIKTLESALRFGYPVLVQDVEKIDPIMNSLLNKETFKQGGRTLIRIGDQEIDFSNSFNMFMVTRDSSCNFTPDLCSRVTFLNFTITPSSLQNQILSIVLKAERPEINNAKEELIKSQREYKVQLRELEESLLVALNSEGNLLDNNKVMGQLETIKLKSMEISEKVKKTEDIMRDLEVTSNEYLPIAKMSSKIFFSMESLESILYLYKYSLSFFMDILYYIINSEGLKNIDKVKYTERQEYIINNLFKETYHRVGLSLMNKDRVTFGMKLAQIRLGNKFKDEITVLTKSQLGIMGSPDDNVSPNILNGKLTANERRLIAGIKEFESFSNIIEDFKSNEENWINFIDDNKGDIPVPTKFAFNNYLSTNEKDANLREQLIASIVLAVTKPDRMMNSVNNFINLLFGNEFLDIPELDLKKIVEVETHSKSPILLCSAPGFDASTKIERLAKSLNKRYLPIAIGSQEGFDQVDKHFPIKIKSGDWLILKNVHLAPAWLNELEKRLHSCEPSKDFRLFLTMEFNPKIPANVLRISRKLVFELPSGIKHSLIRSYTNLINHKSEIVPKERCKLHFLLAWFHAVIGERLRYAPIGWSKYYEFNESDQRCALEAIDNWIDLEGKGKQNIDPNKIPWDAIRIIISKSMYGGRVDNEYDLKILESLVFHCFNSKTFDLNYSLFKKAEAINEEDSKANNILVVPEARNNAEYLKWIEDLPNKEQPEWSGLPNNVEKLLKENTSKNFIIDFSKIQQSKDTSEEIINNENNKDSLNSKKNWYTLVGEKAEILLKSLPQKVNHLVENKDNLTNPIFRFLNREVTVAQKLLKKVLFDLQTLIAISKGDAKTTNELRDIADNIMSDTVPKSWKVYPDVDLKVTEWILDLKNRINQLNFVSSKDDLGKSHMWMGGIIFPEAYLTATRQYVAQKLKVSLDELSLKIELSNNIDSGNLKDNEFGIVGINLEGAEWNYNQKKLIMSDSLAMILPKVIMKWVKKSELNNSVFYIPVYRTTKRKQLLFSIYIDNNSELSDYDWYRRGIALIGWNKTYDYKS